MNMSLATEARSTTWESEAVFPVL